MTKLQQQVIALEEAHADLAKSGLDAVLTPLGPLLVGDARFAVTQSEARYRCLIDRLGVIVIELTPSGKIVYTNEATSVITGISTVELLGRNWLEIIKPNHASVPIDKLRREFVESGELKDFQTSIVTIDDSWKVISWNAFDIFDRNSQIERIVYFGIDITEQQRLEQELAIAAIAFDSNEAMMISDAEGSILRVNPAYTELTGYSAADVIGKHHSLLKSDRHKPDFYAEMRKSIHDTGAWTGELWNQRKNGEFYQEFRTINAVKNMQGLVTHYVATHNDITNRKLIENNLIKLSMALEQSQTSVMITDLETKIEYVNQAFVNTTGYSREEIIGQKPSLLKSGKTPKTTYEAMWEALLKGKAWQGEVTNLNKQGEEFIELTWISPIRQLNGEISHYLGVKENITERKQNEILLLAAKEQAETLAATKTQFLANMSHEIRTPMSAIIGFSQLALLKDFPPEARSYLKKINTAATSLLDILNDILDLSKLEAGRLSLILAPFCLDALKDTLYSLFINVAQQHGLALTLEIAPDVPDKLIGDVLRLRQVLINLLGNALKFTSSGSVGLSITLLESDESKARLLFNVKDTGIGIAAEDQSQLFLPFNQADNSNSRRFGGTGLGLSISNDLLKLMDSEILLDSSPGLGSCFSFELVLAIPSKSMQNQVEHELKTRNRILNNTTQVLAGAKILVVEDNTFNQQIIKELLSQAGILSELANNGQEALEMLKQGEFNAVLMDLHMPIMNGFEATKQIRSQACFAILPVIALTASVSQADRELCLAVGMNDFIGKPFNSNQLLSTLAQWIKPEQAIDTASEDLTVVETDIFGNNQLPGFDIKNLLLALSNNQEMAMQLLLSFSASIKNLPAELDTLLAAGEREFAKEKLHTIKGAAGNLGATRLHAAAQALEAEINEGLPTVAVINIFKTACTQVVATMAAVAKAPEVKVGNPELLLECAIELDALLEVNDYISDTLLNTLKTHLLVEQYDVFILLRNTCNKLDYNQTRKVLRQLVTLPEIVEY